MSSISMNRAFLLSIAVSFIVTAAVPLVAQQQNDPFQDQQQDQQQDPMMQQQAPQAEFDDTDIAAFADALVAVESIEQGMQQEMETIMQDGELESERFQELHQHYSQTQGSLPEDVSAEEQTAFNATFEALVAAEQEVQQEMIEVVENAGLDVQTFNEIVMAAQQDPDLWDEVQAQQDQE